MPLERTTDDERLRKIIITWVALSRSSWCYRRPYPWGLPNPTINCREKENEILHEKIAGLRRLNEDNTKLTEENAELKNEIERLENSINVLQGKLDALRRSVAIFTGESKITAVALTMPPQKIQSMLLQCHGLYPH